ncbi:MAG: transcriptional repressor [Bacteroidetes bacterium]|nr:MAG: transcriptional repressor [Bacteroidota bacterium]
MKISGEELSRRLAEKGLRITPQRLAVLEAVHALANHPTAEMILARTRQKHPNIAIGTIYKVLDTLVGKQLLKRVHTDKDAMRYDALMSHHHHLYCSETDLIGDYHDEGLDKLIREYFQEKEIEGFDIDEFSLQIRGRYRKKHK